jgi:hypothetical protein
MKAPTYGLATVPVVREPSPMEQWIAANMLKLEGQRTTTRGRVSR